MGYIVCAHSVIVMKKKNLKIVIVLIFTAAILLAGYFIFTKKAHGSMPARSIVSAVHKPETQSQKEHRMCQPVLDPKNNCSVSKLASAFPDPIIATQASAICNLESQGDSSITSYVDFCRDGNPYSFGLFQINVIAKENLVPACADVFTVHMNAAHDDIACIKSENGICIIHDCRVANTVNYNACKAYITDPANNIKIAAEIHQERGWGDWGSYAFCRNQF